MLPVTVFVELDLMPDKFFKSTCISQAIRGFLFNSGIFTLKRPGLSWR